MAFSPAIAAPPVALGQSSGMGGVIGWSLVLLGLCVAGFYGVIHLRRWMKEEDVPSGGIGFTLSDLRQLHREGKMTDEEFERARAKFVAAGKAMADKLPDPLAGRRPRPDAARAADSLTADPRRTRPPPNNPAQANRPSYPRPPAAPPGRFPGGSTPPAAAPPPPPPGQPHRPSPPRMPPGAGGLPPGRPPS